MSGTCVYLPDCRVILSIMLKLDTHLWLGCQWKGDAQWPASTTAPWFISRLKAVTTRMWGQSSLPLLLPDSDPTTSLVWSTRHIIAGTTSWPLYRVVYLLMPFCFPTWHPKCLRSRIGLMVRPRFLARRGENYVRLE